MEYRKTGSIFEAKCHAICNPVNCLGISGKGLALQFRKKYPEMFRQYHEVCSKGELRPGKLHVWTNEGENFPRYIVNFPTKDDLSPSKLSYIKDGLVALEEFVKKSQVKSIAVPGLGCGLGGLQWGQVQNLLVNFNKKLPHDVNLVVYMPQ